MCHSALLKQADDGLRASPLRDIQELMLLLTLLPSRNLRVEAQREVLGIALDRPDASPEGEAS